MINTAWEDGIGVNTEFGVVFGAVFLVRLVGKAALIFVFNDNQNLRHFWNFEKSRKLHGLKISEFCTRQGNNEHEPNKRHYLNV